jgi:hypothetical protein
MALEFIKLIAPVEVDTIILRIASFGDNAEPPLPISNWEPGGAGERLVYATAQTIAAYTRDDARAIQGQFIDLATDPGDPGDPDTTPGRGYLSEAGENDFGTERRGATNASGTETLTNNTGGAITFRPGELTLQRDTPDPDTGLFPTYRNTEDVSVYTNPDGSVTVNDGASIDFPIEAEAEGTTSNANPAAVSILTGSPFNPSEVTVTNAEPIRGTDREFYLDYRARCKKALARISVNGAADVYAYLANTTIEGDPLLQADGETAVNISRVYVSQSSTTGTVTVYYASPSGAAVADDVTAANANIQLHAIAAPDCITFSGLAAVEVTVNVTATVKLRAAPGLDATTIEEAVEDALAAYFETVPIGGYDQTAGAGTLYADAIKSIIGGAYPGIYHTTMAAPAGDTALALGEVAVLGTTSITVTLI